MGIVLNGLFFWGCYRTRKRNANKKHYDVGKKVRDTIKELGGEMPENLPTPEKRLTKVEREQKRLDKKD